MEATTSRQNVGVKAFYLVTGALAVMGAAAIAYRFLEGLKVTALTSNMTWGLWIAFYILFVGLSAGSFLLSTMIYVFGMRQFERVGRIAILTAILSLVGALLFVFVDLGHMERFWHMLAFWNPTSIMAIEFALYNLYIVLMLVELWFLMRLDLAAAAAQPGARGRLASIFSLGFHSPAMAEGRAAAEATAMRVVKVCGIIGIPTAIGVHGGTGAIFAVAISRPYWNSGLFPVLFLVSALASGAALVTLLYALLGRRDAHLLPTLRSLAGLMILFVSIDALLVLSDFVAGAYQGGTAESQILGELAFGRFSAIFWLGEFGLGLVLPILLVTLGRHSPFWLGTAGLSMLLGIAAVRYDIVAPAYVNPVLTGLDKSYLDVRFLYQYVPSGAEWAISAGLIGALALLLGLALDVLPMGHGIRAVGTGRGEP